MTDVKIKGAQCFVKVSRPQQFEINKNLLILCQKLPFLSENFRVWCKYDAIEAMGAMYGTVQEGSIPTWMKSSSTQLF